MKHLINDNTILNNKKNDGLYINNEKVVSYKTKKDCENSYYNLYAYVDLTDWNSNPRILNVKVGWAKNGVSARYKSQDANHPTDRVIGLWHIESDNVADYAVHHSLQEVSKCYKKDNLYHYNVLAAEREDDKGSTELYVIESVEGLNKLIEDINNATKTSNKKETIKIYEDIAELIYEIKNVEETNYIMYLCTRWGKTNTFLELAKLNNMVEDVRITLMCAYVGTVRNSYSQNCATLSNYEHILFVDPDNYSDDKELCETIINWLNKDQQNHVMFYVALTGNEDIFNRRISVLKQFKTVRKQMIIEEADLACHCEKQLKKIKVLKKMNSVFNFITTGTGWNKVKKISEIFENPVLFKREYLKDILGNV